MGMVWNTLDYIWEENYAEAVKYYCQHGDLNVPQKYTTDSGVKLGQWIGNLKFNARRGTIPADRLEKLQEIGFDWRSRSEKSFEKGFQELLIYNEKFGNYNVPMLYVTDGGFKLGDWLYRKKVDHQLGRLPKERYRRLTEIGVDLTMADDWDEKMKLVEAYYAEHGNADIPARYVVEGVWLNTWYSTQRRIVLGQQKGSLSDEQLKRLEAVGMKLGLTKKEELWQRYYEQLKAYYDEHGNIDINASHNTEIGRTVGHWLVTQRKYRTEGKLTEKQIQMLDALGMEWRTPDEVKFDDCAERIRKYKDENGDANIPFGYTCEDGLQLGRWLNNLRVGLQKNPSRLSPERLAKLRDLGVILESRGDVWQKRYDEVSTYFAEHGVKKLPMHHKSADGVDLYDWIIQQKRAYKEKRLASERIDKLRAIGIQL